MIRSIDTKLQDRPTFRRCSPHAKLLYYTLRTHPKGHLSGLFHISLDYLALDTGLSDKELREAIKDLTKADLLAYDFAAELVWVKGMLEDQGRGEKIVNACVNNLESLHPSPVALAFATEHEMGYPYDIDTPSIPYSEEIDGASDLSGCPSISKTRSRSDPEDLDGSTPHARSQGDGVQGSLLGEQDAPQKKRGKPPAIILPEWLPDALWEAWRKHRKDIRATMTPHAEDLLLRDLAKMYEEGHDIEAVIHEAIKGGWKKFFRPSKPAGPPRNGTGQPVQQTASEEAEYKEVTRQAQERIDRDREAREAKRKYEEENAVPPEAAAAAFAEIRASLRGQT